MADGNESSVHQAEVVLPVTAVAIAGLRPRSLFLAGQGCRLNVFDRDSGVLLASDPIFKTQAIHGIKCQHAPDQSQTLCLIWGGSSIGIHKVVLTSQGPGEDVGNIVHVIKEWNATDWIPDASFCFHSIRGIDQGGNLPQAIFLTSHNVLYSLCTSTAPHDGHGIFPSSVLLATGPSSILYSAHVQVHATDQVFVAAGTVFGEVLFWKHDLKIERTHSENSTEGQLLYSFLGHEGSVFGVRISELPVESNSPWLIASCSDDRTIRVWDISDTLKNGLEWNSAGRTIEKVDTGFEFLALRIGAHPTSCLATIMGHASRIWSVRFLPSPGAVCELISAGEDAKCQTWLMIDNPNSKGPNKHVLRAQDSYDYHNGKNIWGIAVKKEVDGTSLILTGGADGHIVSYNIPHSATPLSKEDNQKWTGDFSTVRSASYSHPSVALDVPETRPRPTTSPAKVCFASMRGHWIIHRVLRSMIPTYPSGTFIGTASVIPRDPTDHEYDAEYLYIENGELTTEQGLCVKGSRSYVYRFQDSTDSITAWFVKTDDSREVDYLFHIVEFNRNMPLLGAPKVQYQITANGYHLCVADNYSAEYNFQYGASGLLSWGVKYKVNGPKKDYTADATYTPRPNTMGPDEDSPHREEEDMVFKDKQPTANHVDSFKNYCWIGPKEILCCTAQGRILRSVLGTSTGPKGSLAKGEDGATPSRELSWDAIDTIPDLASYSIATYIPNCTALFGAACGTVYCYKRSTQSIVPIQKLPRKVTGLFAQQVVYVSKGNARLVATVATCLGDPSAYCFFFKVDDQDNSTVLESISLQLPPHFVVTSTCFTDLENMLVLGSRSGALAFYDRSTFSANTASVACYCIRHVHGEDAVTVVKEVPQTEAESIALFLLTAGRNGKFVVHHVRVNRISQTATETELETVHMSEPPFGPNIEGAYFDPTTNHLLLWGFRSTDFVVWNESKQTEIMKIACGGSHRSWAYFPSNHGFDGGNFVWTKASTCHIQIHVRASHRVLQPGGHGREIKAMAICSLRQEIGGRSGYFIATGAEDTSIRISLATGDSSEGFKCLGVISKHNTGLQQLCWSPDSRYLVSAGGRDEFFIWKIQPVPCLGIGFTCLLQATPITDTLELRIMDFNVAVVRREDESSAATDYLLSVAYSDSTVRVSYLILCHYNRIST